ncbi:MAG: energy transducer TonB [Opitutales bacterium]
MTTNTYRLSTLNKSPLPIIVGGLVSASLFFLLPLTQYFAGGSNDDNDVRKVAVTPPPPPVEFEEPPPIEEPPPEVQVEQLETPPPEISLSAIGASLAVNAGAGGISVGLDDFNTKVNAADEMIFSLAELDRVPRRLSGRKPEYPYELRRNKIEGHVRLEVLIDEQGRVEVLGVLESTHREFERPAIESAESCIFEKPMKDGKAVKTKFIFPFPFTIN